MVLAISVSGFFGFSAVGPSDRFAHAAEVKPAWQEEWEKVLAAAKKEGQVTVYISGYEAVLPEFEKEYPEIKLISVSGRGSQLAQRLITERRGDKYLADVFNSGGVTTHGQLHMAKVLDPIKPALILPEITDTSKWYQKRHHYNDTENQYVFSYVGSATYGAVNYNTKLVDVKDFKSYWDLLNPKWKGKIVSRDVRMPGPGSGNHRLFYHHPEIGPSFIRKLYGEMDVTLFRDYRQGPDWLAVGKFAICFSCDVDVLKQKGLPVDTFGPNVFKEGGGLVQQFGTVDAGEPGAPSQRRQGVHQLALVAQRADCIAEGYRKRRKSLRFAAHRHSERRSAVPQSTAGRRQVPRHELAGVAGDEADPRCHE